MARLNVATPRRDRASLFPAIFTLALWRLRQTWRLLIVTGVGIVAAVVLICAVPIFSQVAVTAGLRSALLASPTNAQVGVVVNTTAPTTALATAVQQQIAPIFQQRLGPYLTGNPELTVSSQQFAIVAPHSTSGGAELLSMVGVDPAHAAGHATLAQGRLPQAQSSDLEIATTPATADALHLHVGSVVTVNADATASQPGPKTQIKLHVVGIFDLTMGNDPFWKGRDFVPSQYSSGSLGQSTTTAYTVLAANDNLLATLSTLAPGGSQRFGFQGSQPVLEWTYQLDVNKIDATNIDALNRQANQLEDKLLNALNGSSGAVNTIVSGQGLSIVQQYTRQITIVAIPVSILLIQILGLVLFFISMMTDLLVERQSDAITVLRSRGASRRHVQGALVTQSIVLAFIALIGGPLIAIPLVSVIARRLLPAGDSGALTAITGHPLQTLLGVGWYAVAATIVAVMAMVIATSRAASLNVLSMRHDAARVMRRPLWQRFNLDILLGVFGVAIYGAYIQATRTLGPALVHDLASLSLIAPLCLLVAAALFFIRLFPLLLRVGERLATRGRSATAMLALAQMARAPRQGLRTTLLLALALAFTIFALIFTASQSQRAYDVAAFQVGADFSGSLPTSSAAAPSLAAQTATYRAVAGVTAASLGYSTELPPNADVANVPLKLFAVDADTYGSAALWQAQAREPTLTTIMSTLAARRESAVSDDAIPAYVDAATWNHLALNNGGHFALSVSGFNGALHFVVVGEVQHVPGVYDDPQTTSQVAAVSGNPSAVVIDYQTFAAVLAHDLPGIVVPPNYAWLRTGGDSVALASVRSALTQGKLRLTNLQDRRALIAAIQSEPLQIDLTGVLLIGAVTALALALAGALITSWLSASARQVNFAVLRALGTGPRQIAGVLLWEQGLIYLTAIVLGLVLGAVLTIIALPTMVFTDINDAGGVLPVYDVPAVQTIIPGVALALVGGGAVLACAVVIALMTRIAARPTIGQVLRLNED